jgi:hypothetical protein
MIFLILVLLLGSGRKENLKGETNQSVVGFILCKCILRLQLHCIVLMSMAL